MEILIWFWPVPLCVLSYYTGKFINTKLELLNSTKLFDNFIVGLAAFLSTISISLIYIEITKAILSLF